MTHPNRDTVCFRRRSLCLALLLATPAVAAEPPCTRPEPNVQVTVKLPVGTTVAALADWYQRTACETLELEGVDQTAKTTLGITGTVSASQLSPLLTLASASAGVGLRRKIARPPPCEVDASTITTDADGRVHLPRATVTSMLATSDCSVGARIVPRMLEGRVQGLRLFSIRPEGFIAKLGLRNGDVVRSVNGTTVADPANLPKVLENARTAKTFTLDVLRRDEPVTLTLHVE